MTPEQRARAWYPNINPKAGGGNTMANYNSVGGKFLWKPRGDKNPNCAVHTPAGVRIVSLTVAGKTYGFKSYGNGYRPLFRLDKPGSAYGSQVPVQMNLHGGGVLTLVVPDGSKRFEKSGFKDTESAPAPSPVKPNPPANDPLFRVTDSGIVFSAKAAPFIEQVFVVEGVNSKGQAKYVHRCRKVNALTWASEFLFRQFEQPAFYAVDVVDRIEHLIPHSVRGWVYVNAKGEIVRFGAQPLPPSLWPWSPSPVPPKPPSNDPLFRVTDSGIVFSAKAAPFIEQVYVVEGVNSKGQAKEVSRCTKANAVLWSPKWRIGQYIQPAFYAVEVADRIESLIPHSVKGWIYVNAKGQIVQFGAQPLPPSLWPWSPSPVPPKPPAPVPPTPPAPVPVTPPPGRNPHASLTANGLRLAPNLVPLVAKVLVVTHAETPAKTQKFMASRSGDEWSTGKPLSEYPSAVYQIFWKVEPPAHIPHHQGFPGAIKNVSHITQAGTWNPPTTRNP